MQHSPSHPQEIIIFTWCHFTVASFLICKHLQLCLLFPFKDSQTLITKFLFDLQFDNVEEAVEEKINRFFCHFSAGHRSILFTVVKSLSVSATRQSELIIQLNIRILTRLWTFRGKSFSIYENVAWLDIHLNFIFLCRFQSQKRKIKFN